jgi:hypothetical protein
LSAASRCTASRSVARQPRRDRSSHGVRMPGNPPALAAGRRCVRLAGSGTQRQQAVRADRPHPDGRYPKPTQGSAPDLDGAVLLPTYNEDPALTDLVVHGPPRPYLRDRGACCARSRSATSSRFVSATVSARRRRIHRPNPHTPASTNQTRTTSSTSSPAASRGTSSATMITAINTAPESICG